MMITSHSFMYPEGYCESQPTDVLQKRPEEVSFEILFQDQTPTADITPAGDKIFLFYTEISLRIDIISRKKPPQVCFVPGIDQHSIAPL